jgi:CubicO group peptidase (beta-lactamase class C family)
MPPLADFLNAGKLVRVRPAGALTAYSSYGIALVSLLVEEAAGRRYEEFVRDTVFAPLGMRSARFMRAAGDEAGVAKGYAVEDGAATRVDYEFYVTTGAASAVCTIADMARVGAMLLGAGAAQSVRVLSPTLAGEMLRQQASVHPKVPGWGLGVQLDAAGDRAIVEHGGDIAGFACLLTLVPDLGIGFFTVHHGEGGDLRFRVRDAVLGAIAPFTPQKPTPDPAAAGRLADYVGRYRSTLECFSCAVDGAANAFPCTLGPRGGTLKFWGQTWVPVGDELFVREDGAKRLGFARGGDGQVTTVSGGAWRVAVKIK